MEQLRSPRHRSAERGRNRLVTEADSEDGGDATAFSYDVHTHAGLLGGTRARRNQNAIEVARFFNGDGVISAHVHVCTELGEVLHEVENERVVVVDDEDSGHTGNLRWR